MNRVLIVDDHRPNAVLLERALKDECQVRIAQDGVEAQEIIASWNPSIVL